MKDSKDIYSLLVAPFNYEDVCWRISNTISTNPQTKTGKAIVVPYLKKEVIQDRLDEVLGFDGWSNEFTKWGNSAQLCRLTIKVGDSFITRENGAPETTIEGVKGGLSDSFKRAAKMLGIGRYLSKFGAIFLDVELRGPKLTPTIRDSDLNSTLKNKYQQELKKIYGNSIPNYTNSETKSDNYNQDFQNSNAINNNGPIFISKNSINTILKLTKEKNININNILSRYKVNSIQDLTEENAKHAIKILIAQKVTYSA